MMNTIRLLAFWLSLAACGFSQTALALFEGDSLTAGTGASEAQFNYPAQVTLAHTTKSNLGHAGDKIADIKAATDVIAGLAGATGKRTVVIWIGVNDIATADSSANVIANIDEWIANVRAADPGAKIVGCTILKYAGIAGAFETRRQAVNAHIMGGADFDYTADFAADEDLSDPTDLEFFNADGTHLTDAGYGVVAGLVQTVLVENAREGTAGSMITVGTLNVAPP